MIAAGQLNCRVRIERPASGVDTAGQPLAGWDLVCEPWASVKHLSGLSHLEAGADASSARASIRIRYRQGIDASMRVVNGSVIYRIDAVLPDEAAREHVDLVCSVADLES